MTKEYVGVVVRATLVSERSLLLKGWGLDNVEGTELAHVKYWWIMAGYHSGKLEYALLLSLYFKQKTLLRDS